MDERLAFGYGTSGHVRPASPAGRPGPEPASPGPSAAGGDPPERRRDWAYLGLLLFTGVLFLRPQDTIAPLRILPVAELAALLALGALVLGRLQRGLPVIRLSAEAIGVIAFAGVMLATVPFSIWPGGALGTFINMYSKVMVIFLLMVTTLTTPRRLERLMWLLVLASAYLSARALIDYGRGINLIENGRVQGAVGGMFKNPNDLALNMVTVIPLAGLLALTAATSAKRLLAAASVVLMVGCIVVSQSRGGTLGLAAMFVVFALWLLRRRPGLIAGLAFAGALAAPLAPASYWERVATIFDEEKDTGGSREARRILLREAYAAFLAHPLTGVGAGNFPVYNPEGREEPWLEVHNVLLQVASELGIVGLLVYSFLIGSALYAPIQARRLLRRMQAGRRGRAPPPAALPPAQHERLMLMAAATSAAAVGWFVCAIFAPVAYHWTFYYVLALAVGPRDYLVGRAAAVRAASAERSPRRASAVGAHA